MSSAPEAKPRSARRTMAPRDPAMRVAACLGERDDEAVAYLSTEGFRVERCPLESVDRVAATFGAEAIVLDADLPGSLAAVSRVRKSDGVISTLPIVLVGAPGAALRTSLDAVEAGGDAFVPRPLHAEDLAFRLRALLELPGAGALPGREIPSLPPLPPSLAPPPPVGPGDHGADGDHGAPGSPAAGSPLAGHAGLSPALADVLRAAAVRAGGTEADLALPSLDEDAIDELIPAELLEPLDAPLDALSDEALAPSPQHTPPPHYAGPASSRRGSNRGFPAVNPRNAPPTPTITPLNVGGEMRLSGSLGAHGAGVVLGAAARSRASGLVVVRAAGAEYCLSLTSGHLLAVRSSRSEDESGALLCRLGVIPREAARFASAPLDAGVRGAALLAARGYLSADALAQALSRAARELVFDLLTVPEVEWEMRPLETAAEIPLSPRSLDALLVLGARARIEPNEAALALGGPDAMLTLKLDRAAMAPLPLTRTEREAAEFSRGVPLRAVIDAFGPDALPALLAVAWLGGLRVEGGTGARGPTTASALSPERTRVRALVEAATARDFFALLGVSQWTTRAAALDALEARRTEIAGLRARHPDAPGLPDVSAALDELADLVADTRAWSQYTSALRARLPSA